MIAVVTGGSGFLGTNLVERLLAEGFEVRCLTRPGGGQPPRGASAWPVDYDNPGSLMATRALDDADIVYHLAGATNAVSQAQYDRAIVTPTRNLLGAVAARQLRPRFVYVSSQAAAGPSSTPIRETDAPRPVEAYGRSKLAAERLVEGHGGSFDVTVVRPCSVFGPYDRAFLPLFRLAALGLMVYPGVERQLLHWLHVADAVQGIIDASRSATTTSRTYFLASSEPIRWRALGEAIAAAVGGGVLHVNLPVPLIGVAALARDALGQVTGSAGLTNRSKAALAAQPAWVCSGERARADFGFAPTRSLAAAVCDTYLWYRRQGWLAPRRAGDAAR